MSMAPSDFSFKLKPKTQACESRGVISIFDPYFKNYLFCRFYAFISRILSSHLRLAVIKHLNYVYTEAHNIIIQMQNGIFRNGVPSFAGKHLKCQVAIKPQEL